MPPKRQRAPVRELITYPIVNVTTENDPCLQPADQFHHVLACGHLITTPKPREPCAPNCRQVAAAEASQKNGRRYLQAALGLPFYCDACVEVANEPQIHAEFSNQEAEDQRAVLRQKTAIKQNKVSNYRKCYIAQKLTSVLCDEDGDVVNEYSPIARGHRYDTALPRTGANMFEDLEAPRRSKVPKPLTPSATSSPLTVPSADDDGDWENVDDTIAEGMKWVQEESDRARRRKEQHAMLGRRAAARPVIPSSSDTGLSSFVINSSSPSTAQVSSPSGALAVAQKSARQKPSNQRKRSTEQRPNSPRRTSSQRARATRQAIKSVQASGRTSHTNTASALSVKKGQQAASSGPRAPSSHTKSSKGYQKRL